MSDNSEQRDFWTHVAGPKWVTYQSAMDALMAPVLQGVLDHAELTRGQAVLDVGCGTGASTLVAAEQVGRDGHVLGADISAALLNLARERTRTVPQISLVEADVQNYGFDSSTFDTMISRFGVMFFSDSVAAFSNIAKALKAGGQMHFAAWGQIPNNPFFTYAAQAARAVLGPMPKVDPDAPGPFAFRDPERVLAILEEAGLSDLRVETVSLNLTPPGTLQDFADQICAIGPVESALNFFQADADQHAAVRASVLDVFSEFAGPDGIRIPAEVQFYGARVPD